MVAICLPVAWVAASGPGALAAAASPAVPAAATLAVSRLAVSRLAASRLGASQFAAPRSAAPHSAHSARAPHRGETFFGAIRAAGREAAPWVPDSGSATKTGLAAPRMSWAMRRVNAEKQAMARTFLARMSRLAGPATRCAKRPCRAGLRAARDLRPTQEMQVTGYFCGPAAVSEMLAQMNVTVSQRKAARQLHTTGNGTDWSDSSGYPVPAVLNKDQDINDYVAVALPWVPTRSELRTYKIDLVTDINHGSGAPLAGDAYEVPGGPHLVGHPVGQTIFHWFDIRGYQHSGAITDYEDSVHGASAIGWAASVPAYSSLASSVIVDIVGARGYDW
jgi:hypothetical protein